MQILYQAQDCGISIHALREEGDVLLRGQCRIAYQFLSTPSARRATAGLKLNQLP